MKKNRKERARHVVSSLGFWLLFLVFFPFLLLLSVGMLLYTPVDYVKFRRSLYQKDFPRKYKWLCGTHPDNEVYTIVKQNDLPVEYLKIHDDYELSGCFLYRETLLDFSEPFFFDEEKGLWLLWMEKPDDEDRETEESDASENTDDCLTVEAVREHCLEDFRKKVPDRACDRVVFFYQEKRAVKRYGAEAVEKMKDIGGFVLYEKSGLEEALKQYIAQH